MLSIKVHRTFPILRNIIRRHNSQAALVEQNEYSETPEYPPIVDISLEGRKQRERETTYANIKKLNTVEEKQIALNMPRYYGWKCVMLHENIIPFNAMPLVQSYTRTHFKVIDKLPEVYSESEQSADAIVKEIKPFIEEAIIIELDGIQRKFEPSKDKLEDLQRENEQAACLVKQINRIICNHLSDKVPHILSTQVDFEPRHEAFWFVGGVDLPPKVINWRKQYPWHKERLHENLDRPVQYLGTPLLTLRNRLPLKPILPYSEAENSDFKVPMFKHLPKAVGYFEDFRHGTNIPGFWPGDYDEFGLLSYHGRGHITVRKASYGLEDQIEALHCQAMQASFGWLLAQANYQGFTTFNDITYPLVSQTVITNGQLWSLYAYQLNTVEMHGNKVDDNPKHNICFGTKPMKLYDTVEDGKVQGLNEDVLKMLVQLYLNAPQEREHEMKPYLGNDEQIVADIEDDNKRCWLESRYKHLVANRPKHNLLPETYLWEEIYKIRHNTRFFEAKRRPFEKGINPFQRRLDEHLPPYIPKVLRPYPKSRKKFETTYYPKV